jgi:hypothetical protein
MLQVAGLYAGIKRQIERITDEGIASIGASLT